ncbi:hypothetical protein HD554DRAFT_2317718 [Boletus coccyginus]|nr:hypothetical protein HD554DRAFT_2317718 [Boletus coccyginus]
MVLGKFCLLQKSSLSRSSQTQKHKGEGAFGLPEVPTIQILKHPILSSFVEYVESLISRTRALRSMTPSFP